MNILLYIGIVQSGFAGTVLLLQRHVPLSSKLLAAWLYTVAFSFIYQLLNMDFSHVFLPSYRGMEIEFTFGPFLYLYTRTLISEQPQLRFQDLLHFLPFIFFKLLFSFFEGENPNVEDFFASDGLLWLRLTYGISFILSVSVYTYLVFILLKEHKQNIKNLYSFKNANISLQWLRMITWGFCIGFLGSAVSFMIFNTFGFWDFNPGIFMISFFVFLSYAVSFYGFKQPELFRSKDKAERQRPNQSEITTESEGEEAAIAPKYQRSGLKDADAQQYLQAIIRSMEEEYLYLNGQLTIQDLADKLDIPRHHITQVLNEQLEKNFYSFVNEYRIIEVKKRLLSDKYKNLTLLAIAYDCGFNSKSAFNTVFKQSTGQTPSEWKKQQAIK